MECTESASQRLTPEVSTKTEKWQSTTHTDCSDKEMQVHNRCDVLVISFNVFFMYSNVSPCRTFWWVVLPLWIRARECLAKTTWFHSFGILFKIVFTILFRDVHMCATLFDWNSDFCLPLLALQKRKWGISYLVHLQEDLCASFNASN